MLPKTADANHVSKPMLRRFRIRTRLFIAFSIVVFFTVMIGLTSFVSMTSIGNLSEQTLLNARMLSTLYVHNVNIDAGVFYALYPNVTSPHSEDSQPTRKLIEDFGVHLHKYYESRQLFNDVAMSEEMQERPHLLEVFEEFYCPALNDIFDSLEHGRREDALDIYHNRFSPMCDMLSHHIAILYNQYLDQSSAKITRHNEHALMNAYGMLMMIVVSIMVSVVLAFIVMRSISDPLARLETAAEKIANGELDVQFEQTDSHDEIAHLSKRLADTMAQLTQMQRLKLETLEAQHAKEKAEALFRAKSDFLAKVSHEIRTPMNAVIGMAELALREPIPPAAYEHVSAIKQSGNILLAIINSILDFSKIESGKLEIVPVGYLFSSLLNDIVSVIRVRLLDTQVQFVMNVNNDIPNALSGDELRIRQILLNILGNAVKYTDKGHVSLDITGCIAASDIVHLTMKVTDSGRGIKPEDIGKLFDDFIQVDLTSNTGIEGTGLGLSIARNLARAMGGDIVVRSEYGVGSTFTITLPQAIREHGTLATVEHPNEKSVLVYELRELYAVSVVRTLDTLEVPSTFVSNYAEFRREISSGRYPFVFIASPLYHSVKAACSEFGAESTLVLLTEFGESIADQDLEILAMPVYPTSVANVLNGSAGGFSHGEIESVVRFTAPEANVLIVDDIGTNLKIAEGLLQPYEMRLTLCQSGMEAIDAMAMRRYDVVFMDHMMPTMDGIETVARIRTLNAQDPYFANVPIIALTANAVSGAKEMFLANGFNDFLSKPVDTIRLNAILEKWIAKEKQKKFVIEIGSESALRKSSVCPGLLIEGLDTQKGITMSGGTVENYKRILAVFRRDGVEKTEQITKCLRTDNVPLYVTHVHALKSAASNIGAEELSEIAHAAEIAGEEEDRELVRMLTPKLLSGLSTLLTAIDIALESDAKAEQKATDTTLLKAELEKLAVAIDSVNPRAINDAVKTVQPFTQAADVGKAVEEILRNVSIGEYDEAIALIRTGEG